jgi:hypothetical protein
MPDGQPGPMRDDTGPPAAAWIAGKAPESADTYE